MKTIRLGSPQFIETTNRHRIDLPRENGSGKIEVNTFNSGLQLRVVSTQLGQTTVIKGNTSDITAGFGFCLDGYFESRSDCSKNPVLCKPGMSGFFRCSEFTDSTIKVAREPMLYSVIGMRIETLNALAQNDEEHLSPLFERMNSSTPCLIPDILTPAMRMAFHQMFNCPYVGTIRDLFLEGKVMELVAHKLEQLRSGHASGARKSSSLRSPDIERIRYAAAVLANNLEQPPDMTALAHGVGMGRSKFYQCFRSVYGLSPFEYLREQRLETAKHLLLEGAMNVTEAALSVGYGHLSYFAKAFKAKYGLAPKEFLNSPPRT